MREIIHRNQAYSKPSVVVGTASNPAKRYVDARGAVWSITIPSRGDISAESVSYRASQLTAATLDLMLDAIESFSKAHTRIVHSPDDTGSSDEGKIIDGDNSEWQAFFFTQQTDLEPAGQSGYYASRYGSLVGPSPSGTKDLTSLVNRYLDRVSLGKGSISSLTDSSVSAASKIDDMPAPTSATGSSNSGLFSGNVPAIIIGSAVALYLLSRIKT